MLYVSKVSNYWRNRFLVKLCKIDNQFIQLALPGGILNRQHCTPQIHSRLGFFFLTVQFPRRVSSHASPSLVIPSSVMFTCIPRTIKKEHLEYKKHTEVHMTIFSERLKSRVWAFDDDPVVCRSVECPLQPAETGHRKQGAFRLPVDPTGRNLSLSLYGTFQHSEFSNCKDEDKVIEFPLADHCGDYVLSVCNPPASIIDSSSRSVCAWQENVQ